MGFGVFLVVVLIPCLEGDPAALAIMEGNYVSTGFSILGSRNLDWRLGELCQALLVNVASRLGALVVTPV